MTQISRRFYGASYLFDQIGGHTDGEADLKICFPETYKQIISIAYYLNLEENNAFSRFFHWQRLHHHPYGREISSQRSSDLFQSIEETDCMGFYSRDNINALFKHPQKFIIGVRLRLKFVKEVLADERETLKLWSNLDTQFNTYAVCRFVPWDYEQKRPYKGDLLKEKRCAYLHLFYNPEKAAKNQMDQNDYLTCLHHDLKATKLKEYRMKDYDKYFEVTKTPKSGRKIKPRDEAMREATRNYDYFALFPMKSRIHLKPSPSVGAKISLKRHSAI